MTFSNIAESKNYFQTLEEAIVQRPVLWNKNNEILESLKQDLFDYIDVEELFIINEFMEKDIHTVNKIDVLIEMSKLQFEQLLEKKILDKYSSDGLNFHIKVKVENENYIKTENFYKIENLIIKNKQIV